MADAPPGSNSAGAETALLEALWRGDELAAALRAAEFELDAAQRRLARAAGTIADLTEIGDAAQLAIDQLRSRVAEAEAEAGLYLVQQRTLAEELFAAIRQREARPARGRTPWRAFVGLFSRR